MLVHSFNRFYVVMKFILPTANDVNFAKFKFDGDCDYLRKRDRTQSWNRTTYFRSYSIL